MDKYYFFSIEKTVQIFYYIQKFSQIFSKLELIKLLFFADRIHIRKYFSLISLDMYVALKYGPVASRSLDVLNKEEERLDNLSESELKHLNNIKFDDKKMRTILPVEFDLLSNNEKQSLDKSIELFSGKNLINISHDYPEWKRFKELFDSKATTSELVKRKDFFRNPNVNESPAIQKYFNSIDPLYEDEDYLKEAEQFYFESLGKYVI
jgi:uncharacterized phage-associated protein